MAMADGAAIDAIEINEIVGCIAGDDTNFLAITSKENAKKAAHSTALYQTDML